MWHVIEVVIASILVLTLAAFGLQTQVDQPSDQSSDARSILERLDNEGTLRPLAVSMDVATLNSSAITVFNYSFEVCSFGTNCTGNRPTSRNVWTASYVISGDSSYAPRTVKLFLS